MRLNQFDPRSIRVRRGGAGGGTKLGGAGGLGCGGLVIVLIGALVFGVDPGQMAGLVQSVQQTTQQPQYPAAGDETAMDICDDNPYAMEGCNALASLNQTWEPLFVAAGERFEQPTLVYYTGGTASGCGNASSSVGPFYCPADQGIYIDTGFYDVLHRQLGAGGDFARYYVMAHEYGHHIQHLTGIAAQVRQLQQRDARMANALQVRPESFTHGSSAQRMQWLRRCLESGDENACNTFADLRG